MNLDGLDDLLDAWLLDELSPEQSAQLQQALQTDSACRRRLVQSIFIEAGLHRLAHDEPASLDAAPQPAPVESPRRRTFPHLRRLAIAAVLFFLVSGLTVFHFTRPSPDTSARVSSGSALVDGQPRTRIADGSTLTVTGQTPAVIQLSDGSTATLDPATCLTLQGRVAQTRQVLHLTSGGGQFQVSHGGGQFRIDTPAGSITVLGTQFTAVLRAPRTLFVSVATGTVRVTREGESVDLTTGQSRTFPRTSETTRRLEIPPTPEMPRTPDAPRPPETTRPPAIVTGTIESINALDRTLVLTADGHPTTYVLTRDPEVHVNAERTTAAHLEPGMTATLTLSPNRKEVHAIQATRPPADRATPPAP